jgi:hypothetical protein
MKQIRSILFCVYSLFGRIRHRRVRLIVTYVISLAVAIGAAFVSREVSFALTTHMVLPEQKIAAVSFLSGGERELRDLIKSAEGDENVRNQSKGEGGWLLVQAMQGKRQAVHVMIDAGMAAPQARNLPLPDEGVKLVFSRPKGGVCTGASFCPFSALATCFCGRNQEGQGIAPPDT